MARSTMRLPELGSFIRDQRRAARLSLRKLSDLAGISNPYLSQIERGLRKPSAEILQAIAQALRISAETLYERAGLLDSDRVSDLVSEILKDPGLSERQKQALIQTYRSFRDAEEESRPSGTDATAGPHTSENDAAEGATTVSRRAAADATTKRHAEKEAARKVVARKTSSETTEVDR
jgi:transcriptional regulator with XRE-family HTH domain